MGHHRRHWDQYGRNRMVQPMNGDVAVDRPPSALPKPAMGIANRQQAANPAVAKATMQTHTESGRAPYYFLNLEGDDESKYSITELPLPPPGGPPPLPTAPQTVLYPPPTPTLENRPFRIMSSEGPAGPETRIVDQMFVDLSDADRDPLQNLRRRAGQELKVSEKRLSDLLEQQRKRRRNLLIGVSVSVVMVVLAIVLGLTLS